MSEIKLKEENVTAAYSVADDNTKKVLDALFGRTKPNYPTLDDYRSIKSYEDACSALVEYEIDEEELIGIGVPEHIIALMKLETISRALWGRNFQPLPDAEGSKIYYYPLFVFYSKKEIEEMNENDRGALLSALAIYGALAGFGYLNTNNRSSYSSAYYGFRLCQETEEKARYFGTQFKNLWAEYLMFNFKIMED